MAHFYIPAELAEQLNEKAKSLFVSRSDIVKMAVVEFLAK